MLEAIKNLWSPRKLAGNFQQRLAALVKETPAPVLWLFGKTQSGKTSLIKFLTGAEEAEIGQGFKPCTRFSREYYFPREETPLLVFLDTRGLEEAGYDPTEDMERFHAEAHVILVTNRLLDFSTDVIINHLRNLRASRPSVPVILLLTCLHDAYPQQQHPEPYPFSSNGHWADESNLPPNLTRAVAAQREAFLGLFDNLVPVDLIPAAEGFTDPNYGGDILKEDLLKALPAIYRQTLIKLDETTGSLQDSFERRAIPHILGYSSLAATAGAIPIPWVDLFLLPAIQSRMVFHLARLYGQPLRGQHFAELAGTLGLGMVVRQALREFSKLIPVVGSVASAALAGAATFALGKAFCYYYGAIQKGHIPKPDELKHYYQLQMARAQRLWQAAPSERLPRNVHANSGEPS